MRKDVSDNPDIQMHVISSLLTYATLRVHFPLVSRVRSCLPDSIPYRAIFPERLPEIINLSSREKAIVHISTGPTPMLPTFSPVARSHSLRLEPSEIEAQASVIKFTLLWYIIQHRLVQTVTNISKQILEPFPFDTEFGKNRVF
jgi:hypothetical protein